MPYESKSLAELEQIAANLRMQIVLHPENKLECVELQECEGWIRVRRRELQTAGDKTASAA